MSSEEQVPGARPLPGLEGELEVVRELGRGGSSIVYLAVERELGREVAVKIIHPLFAGDADAVARLTREARTLARLEHPNIVTFYGIRRLADGGLAMVMQYVRGERLKDHIRAHGPLDVDETRRILVDVARALAHAHHFRVVHRDIKPENIYLDSSLGIARLSDFGIARSWDGDGSLTQAGLAIGTPAYMAPEQIDGAALDGRSDLYSLGLVGYEMLTGERPWSGKSLYGIIYSQKHDPLPPLATLRPGLPDDLVRVIEGAVEKDPERRWPSAEAVLALLGEATSPAAGDVATNTAAGFPSGPGAAGLAAAPLGDALPAASDAPLPEDDALTIPYRRDDAAAAWASDAAEAELEEEAAGDAETASVLAQVAAALRQPAATPEPAPTERPARARSMGRRERFAVAAVLLILVSGAGMRAFSTMRRPSPPPPRTGAAAAGRAPRAAEHARLAEAPPPSASTPAAPPQPLPAFDSAAGIARPGATDLAAGAATPPAGTAAGAASPGATDPTAATPPVTDVASRAARSATTDEAGRTRRSPAPARSGRPEQPVKIPPPPTISVAMAAAPDTSLRPIVLLGTEIRSAAPPARPGTPAPAPAASVAAPPPAPVRIAEPAAAGSAAPASNPYTLAPKLKNPADVRRALTEHFPESLRASRRGGEVVVWLFVDEKGAVLRAQVRRSSGDAALDRAALEVADSMRFVPARNGDRPVGVWLAVPIAFSVR